MKIIFTSFLVFFVLQFGIARKLVVTSSGDDIDNPTVGMLRYYVENFAANDTITFSVDKVSLDASLRITNSVIIDGSSMGMVTLDGQYKDNIFNISTYFSSSKVSIKNLKIVNGKRSDSYAFGGGMYVFIGSGSVVVENCIFENNEANTTSDGQGGALRTDGGTFKNCAFINNKVTGTAGPQGGGGIMAIGGTFINCVIAGNTAKSGGGIYATSGAKFYNCTIANNHATRSESGGGIISESAEFINCVSYNNFSQGSISNIYTYGSVTNIKNCAFESGNTLVGSNNNIGLSSSPFVGGNSADSLSLNSTSPCINAGSTSGIVVLDKDFAGNTRLADGTIDIGAYEYNNSVTSVLHSFVNSQSLVYPNPSTGIIFFKPDVLQAKLLSVEVYSMSGSKLTTINGDIALQGFRIDQRGIFQLRILTSEGVFQEKIVIQ